MDTQSVRRLGVAVALTWASGQQALADDCYASPSGPSIEACVAMVDPGDTIYLSPGEYFVDAIEIDKDIHLRPIGEERAKIKRHSLDLSLGSRTTLDYADPLFRVTRPDVRFEVSGVDFRPPVRIDLSSGLRSVIGRVFRVDGGELILNDVSMDTDRIAGFSSLRARGGDHSDLTSLTGGMLALVAGGRLVANDVRVAGIEAPAYLGAALYAAGERSSISIQGGSLFKDIIAQGGAVAVLDGASVRIQPSGGHTPLFRELVATTGGALLALDGTIDVEGAVFEHNGVPRTASTPPLGLSGGFCGGDIAAFGGSSLTLRGVESTGSSSVRGGSICAVRSDLVIEDSTFDGNEARNGGALLMSSGGSGRVSLQVRDTQFHKNRLLANPLLDEADDHDGDSLISDGGAIFLHQVDGELVGVTFESNEAGIDDHSRGGALASYGSSVHIQDSTLRHNQGSDGGALVGHHSQLTLIECELSENGSSVKTERGGAIGLFGGELDLRGTSLRANRAAQGGAVFVFQASSVGMTGVSLTGNEAENAGGAWLQSPRVVIEETDFARNHARGGGGGHLVLWGFRDDDGSYPSSYEIRGGSFSEGSGVGGGAVVAQAGALTVSGSVFSDNHALGEDALGGSMLAIDLQLVLEGARFSDSQARVGGAIAVMGESNLIARDTDFLANRAAFGGAVAILSSGDQTL